METKAEGAQALLSQEEWAEAGRILMPVVENVNL